MRISKALIKNFRCYYDENVVDFNQVGKTTLIYGDSGYGKSSFLQFFRWVFYNDPDFGKDNDKPLFNIPAYNEKKPGDNIEVKGVVEFEHLGIKYSLEKTIIYSVALNINNVKIEKNTLVLQYLENNTWNEYGGDIPKKINSIMPQGLSKYFLLDGERAREIVLDSNELKGAIYSLFGIDKYDKAIGHLGTTYTKKSVLGYYNNIMTSQIKEVSGEGIKLTPQEYQDSLQDLNEEIVNLKRLRSDNNSNYNNYLKRRDALLKALGEANNKDSIEELIKKNDADIKRLDSEIDQQKRKIGNLFYTCYPYLIMTGVVSRSAKVLRDKKEEFDIDYHNMFTSLKKELLKEVLEKDECICGRKLDDESRKYIEGTISIMPPDSYNYLFGQFVKQNKSNIQNANLKLYGYDNILSEIAQKQKDISDCEADNAEKYATLKRLEESKELVDELEDVDKKIKECLSVSSKLSGEIAQKTQTFNIADAKLSKIIKNSEVSKKYNGILNFFKEIKKDLEAEKKQREADVANVLNECVKGVFKQLTTQTELDSDSIQFVSKDFSLRTTFLTGGQLAVDEYSYVIGIIKALQEFGMDNNENPIIIDAPFAFTGTEQSEHIFKTMPSVVKQTVMLTLDLNKIKNLLDDTNLYELYIIHNESQDKATIKKGDINDIKL